MDLQEVQQARLAIGPEGRIVLHPGEQRRHAPLDHSHRDQGLGIGRLDRSHLAARPGVGHLLAEVLIIEQATIARRVVGWGRRLISPRDLLGLDTPGGRGLLGRAVARLQPLVPLLSHRRRVPGHRRLVQQVVGEQHAPATIARRQQLPEGIQGGEHALVGNAVPTRPPRHAFPVVGSGRMHVDSRGLGHAEELVELGQPFRLKRVGLHVERAVGEEHAHAIDSQLLHAREVPARGLGVELLPELRGPARARTIVVDAQRNKGLAVGSLERAPAGGDADLGQGGGRAGTLCGKRVRTSQPRQ